MIYYVNQAMLHDGDGSLGTPFRRISEAAKIAKPGDEVLVFPGVYREYVNPERGGTEDAPILYRSIEPLGAVICGAERIKGWTPYQGTVWTVRMPVIINWCKIVVSCLPAIVFVVLGLDETCDRLFYNPVCVAVALIVFGVAFILVENHNAAKQARVEQMRDITFQMAILIGLFQLLAAAFPGTSRSGATIIGALLIGVSRKAASEFTFILAIPVMLGASLLKLMDFGLHLTGTEWAVLLSGMVSAFLVSVVVIKFLLGYIRKHDFKVFGWYRIVLGVVVLLYFFLLK